MAQKKSSISTHVLDTARGVPAAGIPVTLRVASGSDWTLLGQECALFLISPG
jgi:5-hydroxyisourate hydrolase-like protein (transthyretin family)